MTTRSKGEALDLLRARRAELIANGRRIAPWLALRDGVVHSRMVYDEMERRGLLAGYHGGGWWLGAVFDGHALLEKTGDTVPVQSDRIHRRPIATWRLRDAARSLAASIECVGRPPAVATTAAPTTAGRRTGRGGAQLPLLDDLAGASPSARTR